MEDLNAFLCISFAQNPGGWGRSHKPGGGAKREPLVQFENDFRAYGMGDRLRWGNEITTLWMIVYDLKNANSPVRTEAHATTEG
jgi:hypothetical protein